MNGPDDASLAAQLKASGNAHLAEGRLDAAAADYRKAIVCTPRAAELHVNLGFVLKEQGALPDAEPCLRRATELDPQSFDAAYLHGMVLAALGRPDAAIAAFQSAMALRPTFAAGHAELCKLLLQSGQAERAKQLIQQAIELDPGQAGLHMILGNLHSHTLGTARAVECFERAVSLDPGFASAHNNLGLVLERQGKTGQAIEQFKRAIEIAPEEWESFGNLLFAASYDPATPPSAYLAEARRVGDTVRARARPFAQWPRASERSQGPLRVGLLSGDLRVHPVGHFLESLLGRSDRTWIEFHAYSSNPYDDELTARLKPALASWHSVALASDEALARQIHSDGIQVLVDLAGYTDNTRLPVLAWKPAPVQVSWLGYWASTGLPEVDWFIADPVSVPAAHESHFCERVWRLPATRLCFTTPSGSEPAAVAPPALQAGHVTFGCFQALTKINDGVLSLWAQIMTAMPDARLRVQDKHLADPSLKEDFVRRCRVQGLDPDRIAFHPAMPRPQYLAAHGEVDLLLDTFPYSGATTTCEALWMGVPTVTLAGDRLVARQGASLLSCVGLGEWIATDTEDYVRRAVRHARDPETLAALRAGLRQRLLDSALCDAPQFVNDLQQALLGMWAESTKSNAGAGRKQ